MIKSNCQLSPTIFPPTPKINYDQPKKLSPSPESSINRDMCRHFCQTIIEKCPQSPETPGFNDIKECQIACDNIMSSSVSSKQNMGHITQCIVMALNDKNFSSEQCPIAISQCTEKYNL